MTGSGPYSLVTHPSIRDFGRQVWTTLVGPDAPPFLAYEWLDALEQSGPVSPERGWVPLHLELRRGSRTVAVAPAYLKGNSEGEFVFDHAWANYATGQLGAEYYPKLVVAVPFTPATGPRLILAPGQDEGAVTAAFTLSVEALCREHGLSGAHVLFPSAAQASALAAAGMHHRLGVQFQWHNRDYGSFADFLTEFDAKHRAQIRRERRALEEQGVTLEVATGAAVTEPLADFIHDCYGTTVDKFFWGRRYLNRRFFREVCARMPERIHLVIARESGSQRPLAGSFNLLGKDALYGRYWGAVETRPFLHFNVCYYAGIEDCIARGLARFEPGAGGDHKHPRGFEPALTHSTHLLLDERLDRAVGEFLAREAVAVRRAVDRAPAYVRGRVRAAE